LTLRHGRWWVSDLGSTNGTFVNGTQITEPAIIEAEDVVQFGRVTLRLVR
jgi:pSer/pThr/pTyr-binding forkhead associated (FHA) protein